MIEIAVVALALGLALLGGCTIAAFDERCPEVASWYEPVPGRPHHWDGEVWR